MNSMKKSVAQEYRHARESGHPWAAWWCHVRVWIPAFAAIYWGKLI